MIRGSTPTHTFTLPFDTSLVDEVQITYAQCESIVLVKNTDGCTLSGNEVKVKLTQEETLGFDHKQYVKIQLKVLTLAGEVLVSKVENKSVDECLNAEML